MMAMLRLHGRLTARPAFPSPIRPRACLYCCYQHCYSTGTHRDGADHGGRLDAARAWLAELHAQTIPLETIGELTFSTSSGPGGQNVNKVHSKATLKVPLDALLPHVPAAIHGEIKRSRYLAQRSRCLVVHADDSRKQSDNARSCYRRLFDAIVQAAQDAVPAETSPEQVQRVKQLQKSNNERRIKSKKHHSAKKSSRRGPGDD
ncbi:hypothetical protein yc1106_00399 [Curvularia clavata]|uniref:Prokaryotic-type class I peptide chain release factors domain-containing protein n=1 Tax=Curvularia clavata TaxID=95742 RepID=A0A9Q8Z093_CURCL|nr:hypothetical protein yc1106_00399 [Curvularia clavata]